MKRLLAVLILAGCMTMPVFAAKGPEVDMLDNKLSVNAEAVSLGRFFRLFDLATGMKSKIPPELASRNISVSFSGLNVTDAVKKIFQGQPLDYIMIEGQGVIVTAAAQSSSGDSAPAYNSAPQPPQIDQPFAAQEFPPPGQQNSFQQPQQPPQQPGQPQMIQTPFGPLANPNAQQQRQPNAPLSAPGQPQNSLFPQSPQLFPNQPNNQQGSPSFPGAQPTTPTPFGTPTAPANNPNSLFGSPFSINGQQHTP